MFKGKFYLAALLVLGLVVSFTVLAQALTVTVNENLQYQIMEGWGACLYPDEHAESDSCYLWDSWRTAYRDVGNNLLRLHMHPSIFVASGGTLEGPELPLTGNLATDAAQFDFETSRFRYSDDLAVWLSQNALEPERVKILPSIWSVPHWAKAPTGTYIDGEGGTPVIMYCDMCCTAGGTWDTGIYQQDRYQYCSRYLAALCYGFEQHAGVPIYGLTLQNEVAYESAFNSCTLYALAQATFGTPGSGSTMDYNVYANALKAVKDEFSLHSELDHIKIMGPHHAGLDDSPASPWGLLWQTEGVQAVKNHADSTLIDFLDIYTHNYGVAAPAERAEMFAGHWDGIDAHPSIDWADWGYSETMHNGVGADGKQSWNSEMGGHWYDWPGSLDLAYDLHCQSTYGHESAFMYWQFSGGTTSPTEHTLVGENQMSDPTQSPKYCVWKQFARYIRPGARRVAATFNESGLSLYGGSHYLDADNGINVSSYVHSSDGRVTVVLVNMTTTSYPVDITLPSSPSVSDCDVYRSSSTENYAYIGNFAVSGGAVSVTVPGQSVVTVTGSESGPQPPGQASNPSPANGATNQSVDVDLSWTAGTGATSHDVYFGTDSTPDSGEFQGNQAATTFDPGTMANSTTYYWRIDEVNAQGTTTGSIWSFTTGTGGGGTGTILREWWTGIDGELVSDLTSSPDYPDNPTGSDEPTSFEAPTDWADSYGTRMRGYVYPPTTDDYTFWIASDDYSELWLSTDDNPANAVLIANVPGWTSSRIWDKYPEQQSSAISLTGGNVYYIEALQKEGGGGDNLAVAWQGPGISQAVIDGAYLSPWAGGGPTPPGQASNPSPADGASAVDVDADLSWTAGSGADSHDVYFGQDSTPDSGEFQGNQTGTTFDPGTLAASTTYYWRIDEVNAQGTTTGVVWSFTTEAAPQPPGQASNPNPADGATDQSIDVDLSWSAGSGATSHDVYFGTPGSPPFVQNQAGTTYDPGTLSNDTTYYWRIDEKNAVGTTTGTVWSFTTQPLLTEYRVETGGTEDYIDGQGNTWVADEGYVGGETVDRGSIEITGTTDDRIYQTERYGMSAYQFNVANNDYTVKLHCAETYFDAAGSRVFNINVEGTQYNDLDVWVEAGGQNAALVKTFDVTVSDGALDITFSASVNSALVNGIEFAAAGTPPPPDQATNPSPANGATGQSINVNLSWTAGSGATSRDVYFGQDSTPDSGEFQGNQAGTTYDPGTLANDTTYYWRIDEVNAAGTTTGVVWSFTTIVAAPGQASNPSPANGATDVSTTADLSWTAGSGATSHDVYFGTTSPGTFQGNQTAATFDPGTMANDTTYYWRIDEVNAYGTTTGVVWSFTTESVAPPGQASNPSPADTATGVNINADLSWTAGSGATSHDVYFGTVTSPPFVQNQAGTTYDPGTMAEVTTYFWRIDEVGAGGTTTGVVWSFTTAAAGPGPGTGTGLTGDYYDNLDLTGFVLTRTDSTVNFDWGDGSPDPVIGADTFSVRWTGKVQPLYSETYTFYTTTDDGVRLWVDGQLLIDDWTDHGPTENSGTIALTAGSKYDMQMEYYENIIGAVAELHWSSASQAYQIIPQSQLYEAAAAEWTQLTYDDFEAGWGSYTDGGGDCSRYTDGTYAHQGSCAADIQDNSGDASSFYYTNGVDVDTPGYTQIKVDFWFYPRSMDRTGEDFWLLYYDGTIWHTVKTWDKGIDFENGSFYHDTVYIDESSYTFPTDMKLKFQCDASGNQDDVYIDEIDVSAK